MKALLFFLTGLMLLFVVGCSSDWGTNPTTQDSETATTVTQALASETVTPLNDIEPPVPSCEINRTGFLWMDNRGTHAVRCQIGNKSVTVEANAHCVSEIPMGSYWIQWWPTPAGYYEELAFIAICETTAVSFNPKQALHNDNMK